MRWRFQPRGLAPAVSVTSLLDIVTLLLLVLLLRYTRQDLPKSATTSSLPTITTPFPSNGFGPSTFPIFVTETSLQVGNEIIPMGGNQAGGRVRARQALVTALRREQAARQSPLGKLVIQADGRVPYASLDVVIAAASTLGLGHVGLAARRASGDPR